jgi:hypothetical protein
MSMTSAHGAPRDPRSVATSLGERQVQSPWSGPGIPATAADEQRFVDELNRLVGRRATVYQRLELTVMMTALRSGLGLAELLGQAPGIDPRRLLAAYRAVNERRSLAEHAWDAIANDPSPETFDLFHISASPLMPVLFNGLAAARNDLHRFAVEVTAAIDAVAETSARVLALETRLGDDLDVNRRRDLGAVLYEVGGRCAWNMPSYLPARVGTLMPVRLDALIGDAVEFPAARPRPGRTR